MVVKLCGSSLAVPICVWGQFFRLDEPVKGDLATGCGEHYESTAARGKRIRLGNSRATKILGHRLGRGSGSYDRRLLTAS